MADNICSKCGSTLIENNKFCSQCGAPVAPKAEYICPNCKAKVQPGKSYCANCGTILYSNMSQSFFSETKPSASSVNPQIKDEITDFVDPVSRIGVKNSEFADISSSSTPAAPTGTAAKAPAPVSPAPAAFAPAAPLSSPKAAPAQPAPQPSLNRPGSQSSSANYRYSQNSYKAPYDSFRPAVSNTGSVPSFSIDGKLPTAAYSEKKANSASPSNYPPAYTPPAYSQQKPAQSASAPAFSAAAPQPVKSAPVQQTQLPIDYTQKIDLKDTDYAAAEKPLKKNVYVDEYDEDFYEDDHPEKGSKYEPISAWGFVGIMLLAAIPVIGWIFVIVWACGGCRKVNKRSWARAALIVTLINILITCALVYLVTSLFGNIIQQISSDLLGIIELIKLAS